MSSRLVTLSHHALSPDISQYPNAFSLDYGQGSSWGLSHVRARGVFPRRPQGKAPFFGAYKHELCYLPRAIPNGYFARIRVCTHLVYSLSTGELFDSRNMCPMTVTFIPKEG